MQLGKDVFYTNPGTMKEMICRICNSKCDVKRNTFGPTNFAMAAAKKKKHHDVFTCPHSGLEWHNKAGRLREEIEKTESKRLISLLEQDLMELLTVGGTNSTD